MLRQIQQMCAIIFILAFAGMAVTAPADEAAPRWWKGNLHSHTMWSDGNDFPEMVLDWYKKHGYHFVCLTDHDLLPIGNCWTDVKQKARVAYIYSRFPADYHLALDRYKARYGPDWLEERMTSGTAQVRIKPLSEVRPLFEEPGRFLVLQGEEIASGDGSKTASVMGTNLVRRIPPQSGGTVLEAIQRSIDQIQDQRSTGETPALVHIAHPNFLWAVTVEDLIAMDRCRLFEVYNGHPYVDNRGDALRIGTERIWDVALARRLAEGRSALFGLATDDTHDYVKIAPGFSNPGQGWIMVRARYLTPEHLARAIDAGDFYATTGVDLEDIRLEGNKLSLRINAESGVTFRTQFIGTLKGCDFATQPVLDQKEQPFEGRRQYSKTIGVILGEASGLTPTYTLKGNELYVRARVISSKVKDRPPIPQEKVEMAWTQPVIPPSEKN